MVLALVSFSSAHLSGGEDKTINEVVVHFGYDPADPVSDESVGLSLSIENSTTEQTIRPSEVWVRVSNKKHILFAGTFAPQAFDTVLFSYRFPSGGTYDITARFLDTHGTIVETNFLLNVGKSKEVFTYLVISGIIFLIISIIIAVEIRRT